MSDNAGRERSHDPGGTNLSGISARPSQDANSRGVFDVNTGEFAAQSRLPAAFFNELEVLQRKMRATAKDPGQNEGEMPQSQINEQTQLLKSVRELEEKLAKAKTKLIKSTQKASPARQSSTASPESPSVVLSREDYKNLVDLYFYTHRSRFDPESPDSSPTPTVLEDYSFKLSENFAPPQAYAEFYSEDADYKSPLEEIEDRLKSRQIREISVTRAFVDLLLDDNSSNAALFQAYKRLPQPGVAFLPRGIVRVFLQRMATPWQRSEKSMIRYLSLIDDMQSAGLPITRSEWASAIYLAGRSFSKVTQAEVNSSFQIWKQMENEAGVKAHHVTFNILFDIAVRANKYPVAQMVLKEMHDRGLRLNRLGRVSVIYYHGLRGDGDAVRKAYRDFVDAGEIVDTVVLNCVMAALYNAQEPAAAEQIYERMKSLQQSLRRGRENSGETALYRQYPGPGSEVIEHQMAANSLGRVLLHGSRLKDILPDNHKDLQDSIPLTPDHTTFRTMISHHCNVSGNLNRVTVLIDEMTNVFKLPYQSIVYQLLFKGFALHGATSDPDATWSTKRLNMVWDACRKAIKQGHMSRRELISPAELEPTLPSIKAVNMASEEEAARRAGGNGPLQPSSLKRMSTWNEFVLDLAVFPNERRKHIERIHAQLFDEEREKKQARLRVPFVNPATKELAPQEQETYYPLGDLRLDQEEGEYVLPSPSTAIDPRRRESDHEQDVLSSPDEGRYNFPAGDDSVQEHHSPDAVEESHSADQDSDQDRQTDRSDRRPTPATSKHQVQATRPMVCWLLRAYSRSTGSRAQIEEVWNSVRKVWKTQDPNELDMVVRVLRRCLRDCDRYGPPL